jgi:hypothetical protein
VIGSCVRRGIPIATVLGGGYDALTPLVERHRLAVQAAARECMHRPHNLQG